MGVRPTIWTIGAPLCALLLSGCGAADIDPRTEPPLVETALARPANSAAGSLTGVVAARIESDLGFRVDGKIASRLVDAGQTVHRGAPLMRIDASDLALGATAQQRLVDAAAARLDLAEREERRLRPIAEAGFVSRQRYDAAKAALDAARGDHAAARAQAHVAGNAAGYAVLRADADGVVAAVLAEPGQVIAAGQPVIRLARNGPREAVVNIPEDMRSDLGTAGTVRIYGMPKRIAARLRQLSAQADPATRTYEARYVLIGVAQDAPLGATLTLYPDTSRRAAGGGGVSVPIGAIHTPHKSPGVWVVSGADPTVRFRRVHVAQLQEEVALVDSGLRSGERVVALGAHLLHEGDRVRVRH
jgi:RND family efflux transporter MFP subunit